MTLFILGAKLGLPAGLLAALVSVESGGRNDINFHDGGSPSYSCTQLKSRTARSLRGYKHASDLLVCQRALELSAEHLKDLYRVHKDWDKALCAYNTGKPYKNCTYKRKVNAEWNRYKVKALEGQLLVSLTSSSF